MNGSIGAKASAEERIPRKLKVAVISDVHLGTYGCRAKELCSYLRSIEPELLILNGDIIDMWQFKKYYWPKSHMKVIRIILKMVGKGVPVYYITGNHDEMLRKFSDSHFGSLQLVDKLVLDLDGKKHWFFHGDIFDITMKHSKWLAKLGGWGYDLLIMINSLVNFISERILGRGRVSLSKKIKNSVKSAVSFIDDFEQTAAGIAVDQGFDRVLCGHIHQPVIKEIQTEGGSVEYLNSGDWIENLSALEYADGRWSLYRHGQEDQQGQELLEDEPDTKELFARLLNEFQLELQ